MGRLEASSTMRNNYWRIKWKVLRHYDRIAKIYNMLYGQEQELKIKEALKNVSLDASDIVLDVGCGTGLLFNYISRSVDTIVGIDISLESLKVALDFIKKTGNPSIELVRADADFLPFRNEVFDKVFAITLLQNMPNPLLTLHEISRVAKTESEIVVTRLKKFFSEESFSGILSKSGMNFSIINVGNSHVKGHIAICNKKPTASTKNINMGMHSLMMVR